jgi:peptide chain release factor subunit 1
VTILECVARGRDLALVPAMTQFAAPSTVDSLLDRLARVEPSGDLVISLYLNLQADQHGKDAYAPFLRKELTARGRTLPEDSPARAAFDRDVTRIEEYLAGIPASANGVAVFACAARDLFETVLLDAPVDQHRLSLAPEPQLAPLELVLDRHPRHAVVLADSHAARILVVAPGRTREETVEGEPVHRSSGGGWSQARYQRHVEKLQAEHARELVETLERIVRDERVAHVVLAGDEVNVPLVRKELSKELAAKVIDVVRLPSRAPEHEVVRMAAEAIRRHDAASDAQVVQSALDAYRAGGLAVAGPDETLAALGRGQVDEVYLTIADDFRVEDRTIPADEFVSRARQTSARVRFIEDRALLATVGGVAAALRYRINGLP